MLQARATPPNPMIVVAIVLEFTLLYLPTTSGFSAIGILVMVLLTAATDGVLDEHAQSMLALALTLGLLNFPSSSRGSLLPATVFHGPSESGTHVVVRDPIAGRETATGASKTISSAPATASWNARLLATHSPSTGSRAHHKGKRQSSRVGLAMAWAHRGSVVGTGERRVQRSRIG